MAQPKELKGTIALLGAAAVHDHRDPAIGVLDDFGRVIGILEDEMEGKR